MITLNEAKQQVEMANERGKGSVAYLYTYDLDFNMWFDNYVTSLKNIIEPRFYKEYERCVKELIEECIKSKKEFPDNISFKVTFLNQCDRYYINKCCELLEDSTKERYALVSTSLAKALEGIEEELKKNDMELDIINKDINTDNYSLFSFTCKVYRKGAIAVF
jgi:cobalamin biosynthesis protein CbiG